ncbi:MAG: mechanosensitive ion channel family protein [Planctomycetaceae bacterium]|nr:mechanosensitive ion channel family protein [Planctomycetaceae bacterium]
MHRVSLLLVTCALAITRIAAAQHEWTGAWQTNWRDGGARMVLKQQGNTVTGTYPLFGGRIEGKVIGSELEGTWFEGDRSGPFEFFMGRDGNTFTGRDRVRGWWTGQRNDAAEPSQAMDLESPRSAFVSFVVAANVARMGNNEAWGLASQAVEFDPASPPVSRLAAIDRVRAYFEVVDLTSFRTYAIPDTSAGPDITFPLEQMNTGVNLPITMHRNAERKWHVVIPSPEVVAAQRKALLAVFGNKAPNAQSHKQLQNPRDTMRTFLEGMATWNDGGRALALSTMDLSAYPELLRERDGATAAGYLRRVLNRIGLIGLQSIPHDGTSREPYEHFVHNAGAIVIAPASNAPDAPWLFTADTIGTIPDLYFATDDLPPPGATPPGMIPETTYFKLREFVHDYLPFLLKRVQHLELWQFLSAMTCIALLLTIGRIVARAFSRVVVWLAGPNWVQPRWFQWSMAILFAAAVMIQIRALLGLPERSGQYAAPVVGTLLNLLAGLVAWYLVTLFGNIWVARAAATERNTDDIVVSLSVACARILIVVGVVLGISHFLSIPTAGMIAGFGIGGLAFAYASRETIANVFGAGTLVTDRPFRTGDWIDTGRVQGSVESVGIRSTRIRTAHDSIVIVPNGRLADSTINNLGTRRHRLIELKIVLTEGANAERIEGFIRGVREAMDREPMFMNENTDIGMAAMTPNGVEISISGNIQARTDRAELEASHNLLLEITKIAQANNLSLGKWMERAPAPAVPPVAPPSA